MKDSRPIKRSRELQPFSREHHHGLLLCWKIRSGLKKDISTVRIKKYVEWFYKTYTQPHFEAEEKLIFPILGNDHKLVKKALAEHRRLTRLIEDNEDHQKSLSLLEEELDHHIRFEERILFKEIENVASARELELITIVHQEQSFVENSEDTFWN